ncbi:YggT family protein [Kovacikia minuta CCNUW1]|uniref:YggT family protein n=1 Tax=Kovacikia minuta TaxID=2931930 RepID=UPI001CCD5212|nr:YggT family protein [Kovacikia minuta]UBF23945.1 YggT family protein [Kovacikia minuta CCNUW1]
MNSEPHERDNLERQRELIQEEEAFRLRQEERRLEAAKRDNTFRWILNTIYFLVGLLEVLLVLRFILRLFGANTENAFAQFIYNLSEPFIAPFSTLFVSPVTGGGANIFDVNVLVAIVVYALLGWLAVWLVQYLRGR